MRAADDIAVLIARLKGGGDKSRSQIPPGKTMRLEKKVPPTRSQSCGGLSKAGAFRDFIKIENVIRP